VEVLDLIQRSGPYVQGSGTFPWRFGPTTDILEDIVFSGHVAAPEPSAWWGRALFATRLEIVAWTPRLHSHYRNPRLCRVSASLPSAFCRALGKAGFAESRTR
jgi:hypothetical protein